MRQRTFGFLTIIHCTVEDEATLCCILFFYDQGQIEKVFSCDRDEESERWNRIQKLHIDSHKIWTRIDCLLNFLCVAVACCSSSAVSKYDRTFTHRNLRFHCGKFYQQNIGFFERERPTLPKTQPSLIHIEKMAKII